MREMTKSIKKLEKKLYCLEVVLAMCYKDDIRRNNPCYCHINDAQTKKSLAFVTPKYILFSFAK